MRKLWQSGLAVFFVVAAALLGLGPAYNASAPMALYPNNQIKLYNAEDPLTGTFSQQFLVPQTAQQPSANLSFEFAFAGNPGAFNYQIQDADTDVTGNYVTIPTAGTVTACPITAGGAYTCRVELNPWRGEYGRIYINAQNANSVNVTVKVSR